MRLQEQWVGPLLEKFRGTRILIVGDLILDRFVWGKVERISPEAPVPIVVVERETAHLGGAANVALNLASLGAEAMLVGAVGQDLAARELRDSLRRAGIDAGRLLQIEGRTTSVKTRIVAHHQQVCRTDHESRDPLPAASAEQLARNFEDALQECNVVVLSDYGKGVLASGAAARFIQTARRRGAKVVVDPKFSDFSLYHQATVITPNTHEALAAAGPGFNSEQLDQVARVIMERSQADYILITRGEEGMLLCQQNGSLQEIRAMAREVYDVTGAGDTVVAVLALSLAAGASITQAALLANCAAGLVVEKLGTAAVTPAEIRRRLAEE